LVEYLTDFWRYDSTYARECAIIRKRPLSAYYVQQNAVNVQRYVKTFPGFVGVRLRELTSGLIRDWMAWMAERKGAAGRMLSGRRINAVVQTARVGVRYAVEREELERDPFRAVKQAMETPKEKGVLSFAERAALLKSRPRDPFSRLAVLLGLICGMRRGEIRGLKWGDLDSGLIRLAHNYVEVDGLKKPKSGKERTVPYTVSVEKAFDEARKASSNPALCAYIFESMERPGLPLGETFFRNAVSKDLAGIGIDYDEQRKRNLTFHSLRHSFVTLGRLAGISDIEIQAVAGHSDREMMERYTHAKKVIDFNSVREKQDKFVG